MDKSDMRLSMTFAENDGHRLWYDVQGSGEPLTLIGGFALLHDQFEICLPNLHKYGYKTVNWNYRGSGHSDCTLVKPYSVEDWVEDMRALRKPRYGPPPLAPLSVRGLLASIQNESTP